MNEIISFLSEKIPNLLTFLVKDIFPVIVAAFLSYVLVKRNDKRNQRLSNLSITKDEINRRYHDYLETYENVNLFLTNTYFSLFDSNHAPEVMSPIILGSTKLMHELYVSTANFRALKLTITEKEFGKEISIAFLLFSKSVDAHQIVVLEALASVFDAPEPEVVRDSIFSIDSEYINGDLITSHVLINKLFFDASKI